MTRQPGGEFILYQGGDAPAIDVRLNGETVRLGQQQPADLFQTSRTKVMGHITNMCAERGRRVEPEGNLAGIPTGSH